MLSVGLLVVLVYLSVTGKDNTKPLASVPVYTAAPIATPFPDIVSDPLTLTPNESLVQAELPFVNFPLENDFLPMEESQYPSTFNPQTNKYFIREVDGSNEYLRVNVVANGDYEDIKTFAENYTKGYSVTSTRFYKLRNFHAVDVFYTGSDKKSVVKTTIVYLPLDFHAISYAKVIPTGKNAQEVQNEVNEYMDHFIDNYDWATAIRKSQGTTYAQSEDVDRANEENYIRNGDRDEN